jgi:hypothetical protein
MTINLPDLKKTDQYQEWAAAIRKDNPLLPEQIIEMAIYAHLTNPKMYKQEYADKKAAKTAITKTQGGGEVDCVRVYTGEDDPDLPPMAPTKFADGVAAPSIIVDA